MMTISCKRGKILLVDDDERISRVMGDMLTPNGFEVLLARDGEEAIKMAREEQPGLILMDILMPNTDGYTACSILKSDENTKRIPLVMLTGVDHELNKKLSERLNADGYLVKPISLDILLNTVDRFLKS
jgi:DNA-binding response OmpR family regulator